ncbi:MAG: winged helix-turn-helix domain-containing protein [Deltaproteobacteria bacterium]|nr:winged helix-turn-helix domain-containing protein [Deltaproteobacteria bacterium]
MSAPRRVFSRGDLIASVQGYEYEGYARAIDSHIKNLRKKLAAHLPEKIIIKMVPGI